MIPPNIQRRVAHLDVLGGMVFPSSISYWRSKSETEMQWHERSSQTGPVLIGKSDAFDLDAVCEANISAPDGGIVHINGDLNADLEVGGHHEVILCGDVTQQSTITASGFHHIYIGGSVFGEIAATDSSNIWIDGDFRGTLRTGSPMTRVHVLGNFSADVTPMEGATLLWLTVGGFADHELLTSISLAGYTQFNATVGCSNVPPGLYPDGPGRRKTERGNSHSRWCVLTQVEAEPSLATEQRW